jgi:hypothetical protein
VIGLVRGIIHGRKNVFAFKRRIIGEDLLERCAAGDELQNIGNSNPLPDWAAFGSVGGGTWIIRRRG